MTSTKKILEKLQLLCKDDYNNLLDDCYLIQDACCSDTEQMLKAHNIARKAIVLLLHIWSKRGIIPPFEIMQKQDEKEYISFLEDYAYCIYEEDTSYSNAVHSILEKYGWQQDNIWNYNPYEEVMSFGEIWDYADEQVHSAFIDSCYEFDDIPDDDDKYTGYFVEFNNPKLDMVRAIANNKQNEQMEKEFAEISSLADFFLMPFATLPVHEVKIIDDDNVCHYFSIVPEIVDSCGYPYILDIDRLFNPSQFYKVVKLDLLMNDFINKWMFY